MKVPKQTLQMAAEILYKVVTDQNLKLAYGRQQRLELQEELAKGKKPKHYRIDWIRQTRNELIDTLQKSAEDFNAKYKHDLISVSDMMDVLASTMEQFRVAAKKHIKETQKDSEESEELS
jgi:hypothetical protein